MPALKWYGEHGVNYILLGRSYAIFSEVLLKPLHHGISPAVRQVRCTANTVLIATACGFYSPLMRAAAACADDVVLFATRYSFSKSLK